MRWSELCCRVMSCRGPVGWGRGGGGVLCCCCGLAAVTSPCWLCVAVVTAPLWIGALVVCATFCAVVAGLLVLFKDSLPPRLRETAYLVACEVAAADGDATQGELLFLQDFRIAMDIDRLIAGAIERATRARYQVI